MQSNHHRRSATVDKNIERMQSRLEKQSDSRRQIAARCHQTTEKRDDQAADTIEIPAEVYEALEAELTRSEEELKRYSVEYLKLKERHYKLRDTFSEQAEQLSHYQDTNKWQEKFLASIAKQYLEPYAEKTGIKPEQWDEGSCHMVFEHLQQDVQEAGALQDQIQVLQRELLSKADKVQAAPDGQFALDFRAIISQVKVLSRTTRLLQVVDSKAALPKGLVLEDVSPHHWGNRAKKKCLVEAWVWSVLLELVFGSPFMILGDKCEVLCVNWHNLFLSAHVSDWPEPSTLCETWRYTTMERMMEVVDPNVISKGESKGTNPFVDASILKARQMVMDKIQTGFAERADPAAIAQIQTIIDKSFNLALKMSLQRYRLQVTYPKVGAVFNKEEMAGMSEDDDEVTNGGVVAFTVNPGLTKWGDTHGNHFDERYDIVPALVQLEHPAEATEHELATAFAEIATRSA
ncbi:hypothetical protein HBH53_083210 [Parastagonospora nodorum]|nr:hypothetical protein HBH53_083210 [Parastagonospora nodorum]KAH3984909.1 hypothetical protein HBH52_054330 [Parastagonospora nodorum]KAH4039174.1 hypothetical protein HBI09_044910 [Parastagonospora nodorum]KAH4270694.1 hypothetical protein HBI03_043550 [Parastagonospora nodorum]KAH4278200.1 hypothetical protein HBI04_090920 [Parastagonospora nodorum]